MPKLPNVTDAEFQKLIDAALDLSPAVADCARRMGQGYHDPITSMASAVRALNGLVHSISELNGILLAKTAMEEDRRELEATLRARIAKPQEPAG